MAITNARMQIKRGNEVDFDSEKMLVGEWALSTDKRIVRICVAPNTCIRMATYDAFEVDMAKVEKILEECQTIEDAVELINSQVSDKLDATIEYANQAKQYRDEAKTFRDEAEQFRNEVESMVDVGIATTEKAGLVRPDGTTIRVDEDGTIHADNGTVDYNELENKPSINGTELTGNKSLSDLGVASAKDLEKVNFKVDTVIENVPFTIKNTASGENLHLTDSADSKAVSFNLYGKAEQKQYSGKNLLNQEPFRLINDGTNRTRDIYINLPANTYTFECKWNGTASSLGVQIYNTNWQVLATNVTSGKPIEFTSNYDIERIYMFVPSGDASGSYADVYDIMVSLEGGEYEPFVNCMPSPNPDYPQDIEVSGESYNLLENTAESQTVNGVTFTVNEDKSITVKGTATDLAYINVGSYTFDEKVILSGCPSGGSANTYNLYAYGTSLLGRDIGSGAEIQANEQADIRLMVASGVTIDKTFYPMIRKASVQNDRYMPYGVGSVEVKSCGKNLCKPNNTHFFYDSNNLIVENTSVHSKVAKVKPNTTVTVSKSKATNRFQIIGCEEYPTVGSACKLISSYSGDLTEAQVTIPSDVNYIFVYYLYSSTTESVLIQVENGTVSTEFQEYTETTSTIPTQNGLCGIKVSSGGNYTDENGQQWICDEIVKYADGSGKSIQRIGKSDMGMLDWKKQGNYPTITSVEIKEMKSGLSSGLLCQCYIYNPKNFTYAQSDSWENLTIGKNNQSPYIYVKDTSYTDVETFKADMSGKMVYYELAEPIITDLSAEEIAEIEKLYTFYPVTNISNDADCGMSISYMADAKSYIDQRLALIESAMLNNI